MDTAGEATGGYQPWSEVTPDAARRLLVAAVEAFAERGYHATTTRDIAGRAGMSPAALYIHYKTKEELLHRISRIGHDKALDILESAASGPGSAAERLDAAVRSFVRWHAAHHTTARVVQYELDALAPEHRLEIVALRRQSDAAVRRILAEGVAAREFDVPDVPGTTLAVLSLCIDVARWFSVDGRRTPDEVGALYADLVLRMVGAPPAAVPAPDAARQQGPAGPPLGSTAREAGAQK
ncbi:TetR/AcrR family transcriptional regulator [Streptomyces sp. NPDC006326]|uniref:TetR/AcrR family transcriptional regulator n=1 Tax=Streptomyces sp. NPDC006326 TaxID=3156752 RepID=UPI0033AE1029